MQTLLFTVFFNYYYLLCFIFTVFTEKYCTEHKIEKLPGPRDWVQILQDQIKLARRRLKRGADSYLENTECLFYLSFVSPSFRIRLTVRPEKAFNWFCKISNAKV